MIKWKKINAAAIFVVIMTFFLVPFMGLLSYLWHGSPWQSLLLGSIGFAALILSLVHLWYEKYETHNLKKRKP
jgi:peptidoglycan/LPS O-acetylase OafA/YrhL